MGKLSSDIEAAIETSGQLYQLPLPLVTAICQIESSLNPWAFRYEPSYRYLMGEKLTMSVTERFGQMCSWGLMQVMGAVAREMGFTGSLPSLCQPDVGVYYGCRHLRKFYDRHGNWEDAIASYNAGSPRKLSTGEYFNQQYVSKVMAAWKDYDTTATQA